MYSNVKARVRCGNKRTAYVDGTAGVKQGDVCSPILFSLFINELLWLKKGGTVHALWLTLLSCIAVG